MATGEPGPYDIQSVLKIQDMYLNSLTGLADPTLLNTDITAYTNTLDTLQKNYENSSIYTQPILDRQQAVLEIIENENKRLLNKKEQIDNQLVGTKRMILLNDNFRKKQAYWNYIYLVLIFTLVIYIILFVIGKNSAIIVNKTGSSITSVSSFLNILTILLFSGAFIYIGILIFRIYSRDNIYFDELSLAPPAIPPDGPTGQK